MQKNSLLNKETALVVIALFVLVSIMPIVVGCPGQNEYWVVTNWHIGGPVEKSAQLYTISDDYVGQEYIRQCLSVAWYTDYNGYVQRVSTTSKRSWAIKSSVDIWVTKSGNDATFNVRIYHVSNIYPETIQWTVYNGASGTFRIDLYNTFSSSSPLSSNTKIADSSIQTINIGPANTFYFHMYFQ